MILRDFRRYGFYGDFDPTSGRLAPLDRGEHAAGRSSRPQGVFDRLGGHLLALYRRSGELILQIDSVARPFGIWRIERRPASAKRWELVFIDDQGRERAIGYTPEELDPPLSEDPTPFIEEDDFDFGLYLANLAKNPEGNELLFPAEPA